MYIAHFGAKFTGMNFNTGLHSPHPFRVNFIGTLISISISKCSHEFKDIGVFGQTWISKSEIPEDFHFKKHIFLNT